MSKILQLDNIYASYGSIVALEGINIEVNEGELVALCGVNGAGKSTTLKTIAGVMKPTSGTVTFLGEDITGKKPEQIAKKGISLVPEGRDVFPTLTVAENLRIGAYVGFNRVRYAKDLEDIFDLFPILKSRFNQPAGLLSGGEQQMLAIARGMVSHPQLLMLDEPSLGLSPAMVDFVFKLIKKLHERGTTILLIEQNADRALAIADRAYLLDIGLVKFGGKPADLKKEVDLSAVYLGGSDKSGVLGTDEVIG